jgi:hypothetical protein
MIQSLPLPCPGSLLEARFPTKRVEAILEHFDKMVTEFQVGHWETATVRSGKFVEAILKALWAHVGNVVPKTKDFKVDSIIRQLEQIPYVQAEDSVRLTIPRACRFVYEIASNRGARHDSEEVNPNQMDASVVVSTSSWMLAELLRYATKGAVDLSQTRDLVAALIQKKYPPIEDVEGRVYFHIKGLSAREVALLTLWRFHPRRQSEAELIDAARRHGASPSNSRMAISRLKSIVDDDGNGNLRLLVPGMKEAEELISLKGAARTSSAA